MSEVLASIPVIVAVFGAGLISGVLGTLVTILVIIRRNNRPREWKPSENDQFTPHLAPSQWFNSGTSSMDYWPELPEPTLIT